MQLTEEQLAVLNHIVYDGQEWADNALKEEHILAKVARHKPSYLDAKAALGVDYKSRKEQQVIDDKTEQDKYDNASYDVKRKREYPSTDDQLDKIYHEGIDAWKADMIKPVKDKYPKE
jgi:hypothetical protein